MPDQESLSQSVQRYAMVLRRQWWVTVLVTAVAIVAAVVYVNRQQPVYSAGMKIVVGQGGTLFAPGLSVNVQPFTQTITDLLQSHVVAQQTINQLGLHMTPAALLSNLSVSSRPDTSVLGVTYNDTSRTQAVSVLSTLGNVFTAEVNNVLAATSRSSTVRGQPTSQPVSVAIFDPAHLNPGQVSPRVARTLIIAAALGLIAGLLLAFLRDAVSNRIRDEEEAEASYGAPVIGALPRGALGLTIAQVSALPPKLAIRIREAFQMLTARLRYSAELSRGVIVVTGARPEDGKTTVAAHLAALLATSGKDVIAVEADLHRPALHRLLDVEPALEGVRDVVGDGRALTSVLVRIEAQNLSGPAERSRRTATVGAPRTDHEPAEAPELTGDEAPPEGSRLRLLPAGVTTESPLTVLSLGNSSSLVSRLRGLCDYVVIDTPPLLLSGDAYPLVQLADAVVVVCREQATSQDEARRVRTVLKSLGVRDFSVVLSESASAERRGAYYSYTGESS